MRRIPTWWKQPNFKEFRELYSTHKRDALFFLGSGISIQAKLPNWRELLECILDKSGDYLKPLINVHDINSLHRRLKGKDDPTSGEEVPLLEKTKDIFNIGKQYYPEISSFLKEKLDESGKDGAWRNILNDILNVPQTSIEKPTIHDAIVSLDWYAIVTTNYDPLIEDAYQRVWQDKEPLLVARPGRNEVGIDSRAKEKFIYKIHGDIRDPESQIILTKEDYDAVYRQPSETSTQANLRGVFRGAEVILFAGYSQDDDTLINFYAEAVRHSKPGKAYALVPMEGSPSEFEERIAQLSARSGIKFIGYSPEDCHRELAEFFIYLADPEASDAVLNSRISARRPTIVMMYCGGTIGSSKPEAESIKEERPLTVTKVKSRFDPGLTNFSDRLLEWYQDTYNLGSSVNIDVKWEVLPEEYQVFSENATPELWNAVLEKVYDVSFKYFRAPNEVRDDTFLKLGEDAQLSADYKKVLALYNAENEEYKKFFNGQNSEEGNKSLSHAEFISDFQSRYVLGIVILTGTDTMGYLVSALSFGFQHGPCSMIVTGSNQPPDDSARGKLMHLNKSDAWKNVLAAFYFLQSFGHTLTDAFICFGDTIHHGVNIRKITSELGPVSSSLNLTREVEPFVFRNLHIRGQYMFRLIDGVFCNNYYPPGWITYSTLVRSKSKDLQMRHIRRDPLQRRAEGRKELTKSSFCDNTAICHIPASPSPPLIDIRGMCAPKQGTPLRLVILEGFASGTYPTRSWSNFEPLLYDLYKYAIPIVLISEYGISDKQQSYEVELVRGVNVPVILLNGLTIETALPVLSLVVNEIKEEDWGSIHPSAKKTSGSDKRAEALLKKRSKCIEQLLRRFYDERPNILTNEIDPKRADQKMSDDIETAQKNLIRSENKRTTKIQERGTISLDQFDEAIRRFYDAKLNLLPSQVEAKRGFRQDSEQLNLSKQPSMFEDNNAAKMPEMAGGKLDVTTKRLKSNYTFLYKRDFSLLVSEIARRDKSKGAGPDGYAALSDLGFEYGIAFVKAVTKDWDCGVGYEKLFHRDLEQQRVLLEAAEKIIVDLARLLTSTGVANVSADKEKMTFPEPIKLEPGESTREKQGFTFTIKSTRFERLAGGEGKEKFAAVSFSDEDARFFEKLKHGCDSTDAKDLEKYYKDVDNAYDEILSSKWLNRTSSMDWMLMGIFKGVTCGIADFLRFDDLAIEASGSDDKGPQSVFRKAAHCFVLSGDDKFFEIKLAYYESTTLISNPSDDYAD